MKNKLALVIAVILGLVATYGIRQYLSSKESAYKKEFRSQSVVAAGRPITAGTVIKPNMLAAKGVAVTESAITADHILQDYANTVIDKTINRTVERGDLILYSYFRKPIVSLENKLNRGHRAVTLQVNSVTGVAGNIVPGSYVDILGTFISQAGGGKTAVSGGRSGETHTVLLLSNVKVLAVDRSTQEVRYVASEGGMRGRSYSTVTLAAKPEEASILVHAQQTGTLTLTLRPPADISPTPTADINARNLLQKAADAEAKRRAAQSEGPLSVAPLGP